MKILAFVVRTECPHCLGKKRLPGGLVEFGEVVDCVICGGLGHVEAAASFADFEKLVIGLVVEARRR